MKKKFALQLNQLMLAGEIISEVLSYPGEGWCSRCKMSGCVFSCVGQIRNGSPDAATRSWCVGRFSACSTITVTLLGLTLMTSTIKNIEE
jgi:hypothetical protein